MKKIGIMGGTFNPIHLGHLEIAKRALEQFALHEVLFVPSGVPYMKDLDTVLPAETRCEMTRLAIRNMPSFSLSLIEVDKAKNTYTCETLKDLKDAAPDTTFYFLLGADSLWAIEQWKNPQEIFCRAHVLAAVRNNKSKTDMKKQIAYLEGKFGARISILKIPAMEVSSTMIRDRVRNNLPIHDLVPEAVENYIYDHKLYQEE